MSYTEERVRDFLDGLGTVIKRLIFSINYVLPTNNAQYIILTVQKLAYDIYGISG
jgi:hypothetical protein